jgi:hypothetical protein
MRTLRVIPWLLSGVAIAADPAPAPQIVVTLGGDGFAAAAKAARPTSMWWDPAANASWTRLNEQLALAIGGGIPASADLLSGMHDPLALQIMPPSPDDPDPHRARFVLEAGSALASELSRAFGSRLDQATDRKLGELAGRGNGDIFVGLSDSTVVIGDPGLLEHRPAAGAAPHAAIHVSCDLGPTLALVKQLDVDGISYGLDPLLPHWRDEPSTLTIDAAPAGELWTAKIALAASALPFHPVAPEIAALSRGGKHARVVAGIDPRAVVGLIANLTTSADEQHLTELLGRSPAQAAELFTGDVLLLVDASGILPQGCLALALKPGGDAKALATRVALAWKGQPIDAHGAEAAWLLDTPLGPWGLTLGKGVLVLGNDPDLALDLASGKPGDSPLPAGKALIADIDLPTLAKQWLPLAWRLLNDAKLPLGEDPLASLRFRLPEAASALRQSLGVGAKLSLLLQQPPPTLVLIRGGSRMAWSPPPRLLRDLRALLPDGDLGENLDRAVAAFADAAQPTAEVEATVIRLADGWHVLEDDRRGRAVPLTLPQLNARLGTLARVVGTDPQQLKLVTPPPRPVLDVRCLPEPAILQRHLPPYHLELTLTKDGAIAEERGVPLGAAAVAGAVTYLGLFQQPRMLQYHLRFSGQQPAQPDGGAKKPGVVEF